MPMYRTASTARPAGRFSGPLVVSMRPMTPEQAIRATQITSRYGPVHGAPVHVGEPGAIGIDDLGAPDYGDPVEVRDGELPVFWACGVTPQAVAVASRPELMITHAPGHMFVTDAQRRGRWRRSASSSSRAARLSAADVDAVPGRTLVRRHDLDQRRPLEHQRRRVVRRVAGGSAPFPTSRRYSGRRCSSPS